MVKGGGTCNNPHLAWILADQVHAHSAQIIISAGGFAHLQNQGCTPAREPRQGVLQPGNQATVYSNEGTQWITARSDLDPQMRSFVSPSQEACIIVLLTVENVFWPHRIRRAGNNF